MALLLDQNEAELANMMSKQEEEKERMTRKRKLEAETAATNQPAAPECPVYFFFKNTFTF